MLVSTPARPAASRDSAASTPGDGARVEVCIAGCGLAGLVAGYLLARDKVCVMVLEDAPIGSPLAGGEMSAAVDAIEAIVRREHIACEFERLEGRCIGAAAGWECRPSQALLCPAKLAAGLARAIVHAGGRIHRGVRTRAVEAGRLATVVTTAGHRVEADVAMLPGLDDSAPPMAHVVVLDVPRGAITRALYWDCEGTRCASLRPLGGHTGDVLLATGFACGEGDDGSRFAALEAWARERFPCAGEVLQRYTAETLRAPERIAFIGREITQADAAYDFPASGGTAMTRAAMAGMVMKDIGSSLNMAA